MLNGRATPLSPSEWQRLYRSKAGPPRGTPLSSLAAAKRAERRDQGAETRPRRAPAQNRWLGYLGLGRHLERSCVQRLHARLPNSAVARNDRVIVALAIVCLVAAFV